MKGEVLEIAFQNHHRELRVVRGPNLFRSTGSPVTGAHWQQGASSKTTLNHPVAYTKGAVISLKVKVKVLPAGTTFQLFGINKSQRFLNFESSTIIATGGEQTVSLKGKASLPHNIARFSENLVWNAATTKAPQVWANLGTSGPHEIFVLHAKPIVQNSMSYDNTLTDVRIRLLAGSLLSGKSNVDQMAKLVQTHVNGLSTTGTGQQVTIQYGAADSANALWALLDAGTKERGHCGEASYLMEQMLRLIGVRSLQKHLYGRTTKASMDRGENVVYEDEVAKKLVGKGAEERKCKVHGDEKLWLNFSTGIDYSLNWGEGTVEVNGKLYAGLVDEVGEAGAGKTAAHDLLLKLEKKHKRFQVWSHDGTTGCGRPAAESGAGDPFPPVPRS